MGQQNDWLQVKVITSPEAHEAVAHALMESGVGGVEEEEDGVLIAYFPYDPATTTRRLEQIRVFLDELPRYGLNPHPARVDWRIIPEQNWADGWKRFFRPLSIGRRIVIKPTWHDYDAGPDELVVHLDPGMAFGTGIHPSTSLCIECLEDYVKTGDTVFDVGTGSGILSIVAARLGAASVHAVDVDAMAVKVARNNAIRNDCHDVIDVEEGNWHRRPEGFRAHVVVANIIADIIIDMAPDVGGLLLPGGHFIASGIISIREEDVVQSLNRHGLHVVSVRREGEWVALVAQDLSSPSVGDPS